MTLIQGGIYIPADEDAPIELVELDQSDYKQIQKYTNGLFAGLDLFRPEASLYFSDEGKIHNFPLNRRASLLLWVHRTEFRGYDAILGDALILGPADEETGECLTVPDELVELLFNTERYRYLVKTHGEKTWNGNGLTYDNWVDAYNYGLALADRWTLVEHVKVVAA